MKSCSVQDIVCTYDIYLESHLWHLVSQILKSYSSKVEDELYLLLNEYLLDKSAVADIAVVNVYLFVKMSTVTFAPSSIRCFVMCAPTNPVAPVINTRLFFMSLLFISSLSSFFLTFWPIFSDHSANFWLKIKPDTSLWENTETMCSIAYSAGFVKY